MNFIFYDFVINLEFIFLQSKKYKVYKYIGEPQFLVDCTCEECKDIVYTYSIRNIITFADICYIIQLYKINLFSYKKG